MSRRPAPSAWPAAGRQRAWPGHEVTLLEGGDELFPELERAIAAARREVLFETYIFAADAAGERIARALSAAASRGVRVRLVVDGFGTPALGGHLEHILRAGGVQWQTFRPERRPLALDRRRLRRLHRKLVVVDAGVAFVGGINVVDDRFDPNHGPLEAPRLDYAVRVSGPLVAVARAAMRRLWLEQLVLSNPLRALRSGLDRIRFDGGGDAPHPAVGRHPPHPVPAAGRLHALLLLRDNLGHRRAIEREYLRAIGHARREVLMATAYFFPGVRFRRALKRAAARGVRVRLLLQGRVEYLLPHLATQALYDELLAAGVEITEYRPSFLHAKVAVIDDWATVGSSNIDPFSLLLAREANVVVRDAGFAARLRASIEVAIRTGGTPVLAREIGRRPWPRRLMNWIGVIAMRIGVAISGHGFEY